MPNIMLNCRLPDNIDDTWQHMNMTFSIDVVWFDSISVHKPNLCVQFDFYLS